MLLTVTAEGEGAAGLSFLLHKHPDRCQTFELSFGKAHVFYPQASDSRCTACLLLDLDPIALVRGSGSSSAGLLDQYVNDRPYVGSSLLSVAIARLFSSAMGARTREHPHLAETPLSLTARIDVLPVHGEPEILSRIFSPLGYDVEFERYPLDERFSAWGSSPYVSLCLRNRITLAEMLRHLYVLMPVFDGKKHYYIGQDEIDKLLAKGDPWLSDHPEKEWIANRYLLKKPGLVRQALARLIEDDLGDSEDDDDGDSSSPVDREMSLHEQRLGAVISVLRASGAQRVVDWGCGEGRLLRELLADRQFTEILGIDVSIRSLEVAHRRLRIDRLPDRQRKRIRLLHGSITYRDDRLKNFDAAAIVEVIEHLDPSRLKAFERVVFEHARPSLVVVTTPNREYNAVWPSLPAGKLRHGDHRFEWDRAEFQHWSERIGDQFGYAVRRLPVGPLHPDLGPPSQLAVFERSDPRDA